MCDNIPKLARPSQTESANLNRSSYKVGCPVLTGATTSQKALGRDCASIRNIDPLNLRMPIFRGFATRSAGGANKQTLAVFAT